jgi:hypothetical protein
VSAPIFISRGKKKIEVSDRKLQSPQNQRDKQAVSAVVGLKEWPSILLQIDLLID